MNSSKETLTYLGIMLEINAITAFSQNEKIIKQFQKQHLRRQEKLQSVFTLLLISWTLSLTSPELQTQPTNQQTNLHFFLKKGRKMLHSRQVYRECKVLEYTAIWGSICPIKGKKRTVFFSVNVEATQFLHNQEDISSTSHRRDKKGKSPLTRHIQFCLSRNTAGEMRRVGGNQFWLGPGSANAVRRSYKWDY